MGVSKTTWRDRPGTSPLTTSLKLMNGALFHGHYDIKHILPSGLDSTGFFNNRRQLKNHKIVRKDIYKKTNKK